MKAARVDANQREIVEALRKAGAFVQVTSSVGKGFPDLVVGFRGKWLLLECKDGKKSPSAQRLTDEQITWHAAAKEKAPVYVVNSVEAALQAITKDEI